MYRDSNDKLVFSPSDLISFMESPFITWMDRYHKEFPDLVSPDKADESLEILRKRGYTHEKQFLSKLTNELGDDLFVVPRVENAKALTVQAMQAGKRVIYDAALADGDFAGRADFLLKRDGKSTLGPWFYEPLDTKLALKPKPYFTIQLCCYAEMMAAIQGLLPQQIFVLLGDNSERAFRTEDFYHYYQYLKRKFLKQQNNFDPAAVCLPDGMSDLKHWTNYGESLLRERDHLSIVANIRLSQIQKLGKVDITTVEGLATTDLKRVADLHTETFQILKEQAKLQIDSRGFKKPKYVVLQQSAEDARKGLANLPSKSKGDVWFDIEGYPHLEGGLEYLLGVSYEDGDGNLQFKDWWSHNRQQERDSFSSFIDWIYERWLKHPDMHIYHYAAYEVTAMRRLMGRYGIREKEVDALLKNGVFIDLYQIVRQSLRIGEPKYSLKNVEHLYFDGRTSDVTKATDSIVYYERWLEAGESENWEQSPILCTIRDYNIEDCVSTYKLTDWLLEEQRRSNISWIQHEISEQDQDNDVSDAAALATKILEDNYNDSEERTFAELLAYLLEFHRREAKPIWWSLFDRNMMTEEELVEDPDCLGGLIRTEKERESIKKSFLYQYRFAPNQETKIHDGSQCRMAGDLNVKPSVERIDYLSGLLDIRLGPSAPVPPNRLSLIPDEHVSAKTIADSIYRLVAHWSETAQIPQAIEDFLYRKQPRLSYDITGGVIPSGTNLVDGTIRAIREMMKTTLCIQGPPGTGKTHVASLAICELIKEGKVVGVTSNSHKAIANLLNKVANLAEEQGLQFRGVKVQSNIEDFHVTSALIRPAENPRQVFEGEALPFQLIGGTAWTFARESAAGRLDYLFIDEAGQVAIANLVGMASSTENIVLIGDQMQLGQPIKGSHPGESGTSCLDFLLQSHSTIPADFGIFLDTSWRMHPVICNFISTYMYEDRLQPAEMTKNRVIEVPARNSGSSKRMAGIIHIPVEHVDNGQWSDEEANTVNQFVNQLLTCALVDRKTKERKALTLNDILIVAPYNMQVRKIASLIPKARVGTVDKFQGQEAPIVIISMTSSSANSSSRGLEFVLNKNRINVALSRAQVLAIVIANPGLVDFACSSVEQIEMVNLFCKIISPQKPVRA